jgi:hypothetical protein
MESGAKDGWNNDAGDELFIIADLWVLVQDTRRS